MNKHTDELYRTAFAAYNSGRTVHDAIVCERGLHKVIEIIRPLVLQEALNEPTNNEIMVTGTDRSNWRTQDFDRVKHVFSNRLAALTAYEKAKEGL